MQFSVRSRSPNKSSLVIIVAAALIFIDAQCFAANQCSDSFASVTRDSQNNVELTIRDKMDSNGNIILFRAIGGDYVSGATGSYSRTQNGYSYSLSPFVVLEWAQSFLAGKRKVLIALQNVNQDKLGYPSLRQLHRMMDKARGHVDLMTSRPYIRLKPKTKLSDIAMLEEIKVQLGGRELKS